MKAKTLAISILVIAMLILSACNLSNVTQVGISAGDPWKFYVLGIQRSDTYPDNPYARAQQGWEYVTVNLAVENTTSNPASFPVAFNTQNKPDTSPAEFFDSGGYQRDGEARLNPGTCGFFFGNRFTLWPNFRVRFTFSTEIPKNQSPAKLTFTIDNKSYPIDLQKNDSNLKTPLATMPEWKAAQLGESSEIPKDVKATLTRARIFDGGLTDKIFSGKADLAIAVSLENTGGFNFNPISTMKIYAFDSTGNLATACRVLRDPDPAQPLAPGLKKDFGMDVIFANYTRESLESSWLVICLQSNVSNAANKQVPHSEKCQIYQLNR